MINKFKIGNVPCVLYGEPANKVYLFIHGKCGYKEEAEPFANIVCRKGYQVLGIDLPGYGERKDELDKFNPWSVVPELRVVIDYLNDRYESVSLRANSIGCYFAMLSFGDCILDRCLFVSPILDMVKLIENMMLWAGITATELEKEKIINTSFGETLSWEYYQYAISHKISSLCKRTYILYAGLDNLTSRDTVDSFVKRFNAKLTVMDDGEHWFHTEKQLLFLDKWTEKNS